MDGRIYWIWLQSKLSAGCRATTQILERGCTARDIYEMSVGQLAELEFFSQKNIEKLCDKSLDEAQKVIDRCKMLGYGILTPEDGNYPDRLKCIAGPPAVLYIQGDLPDIDREVCVAIVGTRDASRNGAAAAQELGYRLTRAGAIVISGAAKGIDTAAHQGALMAGGKTVAVLGCGIDYRYNMDGKPMRDSISRNGAVISEYPPGTSPLAGNFPIRNRVISALSLGVAVIEAGKRSGSLLTANLALEQGKDIFAVPGNIGDEKSLGVNQLIHEGAVTLLSPMDILQEYAYFYPHKLTLEGTDAPLLGTRRSRPAGTPLFADSAPLPNPSLNPAKAAVQKPVQRAAASVPKRQPEPPASKGLPDNLSDGAKALYNALNEAGESVDDLARTLGIETREVLCSMTELELYGLAQPMPGRRYKRI